MKPGSRQWIREVSLANGHLALIWRPVPTVDRGETFLAMCAVCGRTAIWRSDPHVFSPKVNGELLSEKCEKTPLRGADFS